MLPSNAAALVGAGVLSVLIFPAVAAALARKDTAPGAPETEIAAALAAKDDVQGAPEAAKVTPHARHPLDNLMPWHR